MRDRQFAHARRQEIVDEATARDHDGRGDPPVAHDEMIALVGADEQRVG